MNRRIQFIDLAKGLGITLVVSHHVRPFFVPGWQYLTIPLFYTITGLMFKDYGSLKTLLVRKTRGLLVPFLFFYLLGYLFLYVAQAFSPALFQTDASHLSDIFLQRKYYNWTIWFILSLFWINLAFGVIYRFLKWEWMRAAMVILMGTTGVYLSYADVFLPCNLDNALTGMPFFYFGFLLRKAGFLQPNRFDSFNLPLSVGLYLVAFLLSHIVGSSQISFHRNFMVGNLPVVYLMAFASVISLLLFCKAVDHLPLVNRFGRYSIVPLCTHLLLFILISTLGEAYLPAQLIASPLYSWGLFFVILILSYLLIPALLRIPWAIGARKASK